MRILIQDEKARRCILLPTNLLFSSGTAWLVNWIGRKQAEETMEHIPPERIRQIKRDYGSFDLVEIESSDGNRVLIRL